MRTFRTKILRPFLENTGRTAGRNPGRRGTVESGSGLRVAERLKSLSYLRMVEVCFQRMEVVRNGKCSGIPQYSLIEMDKFF